MTSIINNNANEILSLLMKLFPKINSKQMFKNQLKMIIYLYLSDTPTSYSNPTFYLEPEYITVLIKYARYIETHLTYFHYSVYENKESIRVNTINSEKKPVDFCQINFSISKKEKHKKRALYLNDMTSYISNYEKISFVEEFMEPYTNYCSPVSIKLFNTIIEVNNFEENLKRYRKISKNDSFSKTLFNISIIQGRILKNVIPSNPTTTNIDKQLVLFDELNKHVITYTNELHRQKENHLYLSCSMKKENHYKSLKKYCQRTILLDVNKMISTLNPDVLTHIKSFINPLFLENIRRSCIREKHFLFPRQKINDILDSMSVNQIHMFCKNNLSLVYDMDSFSTETALNQISDDALFMQYYQIRNSHLSFDSDILFINKKKKIIKRILENTSTINYYEFQRDLFILNKIFYDRRRNKTKTGRR
jgi:hypothetical protein